LRGLAPDGRVDHRRLLPPAELAPFVAHFWSVRWALRTPFTAETLPHPSVHVVLEEQAGTWRAEVTGVHRGRFVKCLAGVGRVFGIKFRPATFQPLLRAPATRLTDRVVPIGEVLGPAGDAWTRALLAEPELDANVAITCAFLAPLVPPLPPEVARMRDLVERMAVDRSLVRVDDVSEAAALDVRTLQRAFRRYVGVSPKWVIQRYRLHEAAERLEAPDPPSLAGLAASLGYADQSHFARDFKLVAGQTPQSFIRKTRSRPTLQR
jgi:AraC-like DNA-binding protein